MRRCPDASADDDFETFWHAYPRRVGKGAARAAWGKAARRVPDLLTRCLAALAWQRTQVQWTRDDGVFVPHPSTYLNQERWDDEDPHAAERQAEEARRTRLDREYRAAYERRHGRSA